MNARQLVHIELLSLCVPLMLFGVDNSVFVIQLVCVSSNSLHN